MIHATRVTHTTRTTWLKAICMMALVTTMAAAGAHAKPKVKPKGKGKGKPPAETVVDVGSNEKPDKGDKPDKAPDNIAEPAGPARDPRARADVPVVEAGANRGPARIEFDDRLVQGQTNKANAIYLFERRESALRSLLKKRTNFRDEINERLDE
jgi:hypothetical protein